MGALSPSAAAATAGLHVTGDPALAPAFRESASDYVSKCGDAAPLKLTFDVPAGEEVSVDDRPPRSGMFTAEVALAANQATSFVLRDGSNRRRYHVRCLPPDFPFWEFEHYARAQAQWYLFAPSGNPDRSHYVILMDGNGAPVWWHRSDVQPFNSLLLRNGNVAWVRWYGDAFGIRSSSAWEVHRLDGSLVRVLKTVGTPADTHEMQQLPNGDFLLTSYRLRRDVDLSACGEPKHANVYDGEIQELTPAGKLVWKWNSKDHVRPCETLDIRALRRGKPGQVPTYDLFHLNSVEPDGRGLVISGRHVSAIYRIDRATGKVLWKLGGSHRPESLRVVGDPLSPHLDWQHDARVLPDGTVTAFDNRSHNARARAVRFRIDTSSRTAHFVEQVRDPIVGGSGAEGSARRLPGGDWVVSWGATNVISELRSSGKVVFRVLLDYEINYRVQPILSGVLKPFELRQAMDKMFPRRVAAAAR